MANQQDGFYGAANQIGQQASLPSDFLESEDSVTADNSIQQRIISGEYAPEPAEYEDTYANYESFGQSSTSQFHHSYAQLDDPWLNAQHEQNIYEQEDIDPADQYIYSEQSSSNMGDKNNPFEEEDDEETYEPKPITKIIPMRRIGQPPARMVVISRRSQSGESYEPEYSTITQQTLRQPINKLSSETATKRQKQPRKQQFRQDIINNESPYLSEQADKARSQAAQRLATKEGWNIFYSWLKKAYEANEREKIVSLLQTCQEADISADLLSSNGTAKLVKEIARKHPNAAVNRLSNSLLKSWKSIVIADTRRKKETQATSSKVEKKPAESKAKETSAPTSAPNYTADENLLDKLTEAMDKNALNRKEDPIATTITSNTDTAKRPRVRAKVKLTSCRKTGLEGDDDASTSPTVIKKDKPVIKKSDQPVMIPPKPTPPPKRVLQQSDMFLAAFGDDKKAPAPKKLKINKVTKVVQPNVPSGNSETTSIKSEWDSESVTNKTAETVDDIPIITREKGVGILRRTPLSADEKKMRKIRFRDDYNQELVEIQYFDIEEGERVNVSNQNYSHESIKRWEMEDEGKHLKHHHISTNLETSPINIDEPSIFTSSSTSYKPEPISPTGMFNFNKKDGMPPLPLSGSLNSPTSITRDEWNLVLLKDLSSALVRGVNSKLQELATERERNTMAAFFDPNTPTDAIGEDDVELESAADKAALLLPARIPLKLQQVNDGNENSGDKLDDPMIIDNSTARPTQQSSSPLELPLPFSSVTINSSNINKSPIYQSSEKKINSPPIIASASEPVNKVDAFIEMLKKQVSAQDELIDKDRDLRPDDVEMELDQDFRVSTTNPQTENSLNASTETSSKPSLTLDALSALAALAGKDSGSMTSSLSGIGNLNLAEILSKVESAQSGTSSAVDTSINMSSYHQYAQEDPTNMPPNVITQIHGDYFQQPNKQFSVFKPPMSGAGIPRYSTPGIRPISTNPRGGYFQTPTNMSRFRTVPCKYFLAGTCNFGESCRFLHSTPDGQIVPHTQQLFPPQSQPIISQSDEGISQEASHSFQLALASSQSSTQSMEAAANFLQRGAFRGRRGNYRGRRENYDNRRNYDDRRYDRRRRRRSSSNSSNDSDYNRRSSRRRSSDGRSRERSRSPSYEEHPLREKSPPAKEQNESPQQSSPKNDV